MKRSDAFLFLSSSLAASALACRPVIAIGWTELAIIVGIILVLFAPLIFRLFRFFTRKDEAKDKQVGKQDP